MEYCLEVGWIYQEVFQIFTPAQLVSDDRGTWREKELTIDVQAPEILPAIGSALIEVLSKISEKETNPGQPVESARNMSSPSITVLPGETVPAQHVNLKLGPGLLQITGDLSKSNNTSIVSTKAGIVNHSANNAKWWVENNSRRVSQMSVC